MPDILESYDYRDLEQLKIADAQSLRAMYRYGKEINQFGFRLVFHQNRVAKDSANLLRYLGYSAKAAHNLRCALLFHDIGKIDNVYASEIWTLPHRPTPEQKSLQKQHAALGANLWKSWGKENNFSDKPHYTVRYDVTRYHHERVDKSGPEGRDSLELPLYVQISCICDAYDGDRIHRPHQPKRRTPREALRRMAGMDGEQKYLGAFNEELLASYIKMKEEQLGFSL